MTVMTIRANVQREQAGVVESTAKAMFAAINQAQPQGVRYTSYRVGDGATYLVLLELQDGVVENPLPGIGAFRSFQENLKGWLTEPPVPDQLMVVGEYRAF